MIGHNNHVVISGLTDLWAETVGDNRICVAILDGPVDQSHPSLSAADLTHVDTLASGTGHQGPASRHGTHVASIIFGHHDSLVKGLAPDCRGLVVPIFRDATDGSIVPCSQLDLARAITMAVQEGAHVINISGGEHSPSGAATQLLADAVQLCAKNNVLIVAAAGNEGCECLHVPGALPSVLAVGAMNSQGLPLGFSNWGETYLAQGVLAPGENILGAVPGGDIAAHSGTSYATPIVTGIAALLLSIQLKIGQQPNAQAVRSAILESAYSCDPMAVLDCRPFMVGSLNIPGALTLIKKMEKMEVGIRSSGMKSQFDKTQNDHQLATCHEQATLKTGDKAPEFSVMDQTGKVVSLGDYRGHTVVLWFYPHAGTPG
jgi:cyanobactin maturation PatA/PatG family protease